MAHGQNIHGQVRYVLQWNEQPPTQHIFEQLVTDGVTRAQLEAGTFRLYTEFSGIGVDGSDIRVVKDPGSVAEFSFDGPSLTSNTITTNVKKGTQYLSPGTNRLKLINANYYYVFYLRKHNTSANAVTLEYTTDDLQFSGYVKIDNNGYLTDIGDNELDASVFYIEIDYGTPSSTTSTTAPAPTSTSSTTTTPASLDEEYFKIKKYVTTKAGGRVACLAIDDDTIDHGRHVRLEPCVDHARQKWIVGSTSNVDDGKIYYQINHKLDSNLCLDYDGGTKVGFEGSTDSGGGALKQEDVQKLVIITNCSASKVVLTQLHQRLERVGKQVSVYILKTVHHMSTILPKVWE